MVVMAATAGVGVGVELGVGTERAAVGEDTTFVLATSCL
jgi:hypothetical protein